MTDAEPETPDAKGGETLGIPWKWLVFSSTFPFLACCICFVLIVSSGALTKIPALVFLLILLVPMLICSLMFMLIRIGVVRQVCARRSAISKEQPSMSISELNETAYRNFTEFCVESQKKLKAMRSGEGSCDGPEKVNTLSLMFDLFLIRSVKGGLMKRYFSIRPEVVTECSEKELEAKYPNGVEIKSSETFEKVRAYMNSVEFKNVMDFITFRKFFVSGMIMWMWILASAIDIYVFFKYLSDMKESAFIVLLVLSLIAIRVACEYTVILFSIADLTRDVRDEMRKSNALKMKELGIKDDSEVQS